MSTRKPFLTAEWRDLVMLNYEVDPSLLGDRVPPGCELDLWEGRALVSVVGFRFLDTRVLGAAIPLHRDFEEVNLRFYVRRRAEEGWRRGVVFVKELVPRRAIALVARLVYGENYVALPMRHSLATADAVTIHTAAYEWRHGGRWQGVSARYSGAPALPREDSEERFVTEHYWGYAVRRGGRTVEYRVDHPPWRVWRAGSSVLECDVAGLYGPELVEPLSVPPSSAFVAEGSPVTVFRGQRLR